MSEISLQVGKAFDDARNYYPIESLDDNETLQLWSLMKKITVKRLRKYQGNTSLKYALDKALNLSGNYV
jgi:hypothetical protein